MPKRHHFTEEELAAGAERVRDVLTTALHGRASQNADPALHLLTGSKSAIERAIVEALHMGAKLHRDQAAGNRFSS